MRQAGTVVGAGTYNSYGGLISSTGTATTPFEYAGAYTDPVTGFLYLNNRYYDPSTGQFITQDPDVAQTGQPYEYADDNPRNNVDPTGLSANFFCARGLPDYPACTGGGPSLGGVINGLASVGGSVAKFASTTAGAISGVAGVVTGGCVIATSESFLGEVICAVPGSVAVASGAISAVADGYLTLTGQQSGGSFALDLIGTTFEFGGLRSGLSGYFGILTTATGVFSSLLGYYEPELEGPCRQ